MTSLSTVFSFSYQFLVQALLVQSARFSLFVAVFLLAACSSPPPPPVTSNVLDEVKIQAIAQTIAKKYPEANTELQHHILDVAVHTLDNMAFVEGGSFMMGDFRIPCTSDNLLLVEWTPEASCASHTFSEKNGSINLHKVTLSDYSLAKYETTYYEMNAYRLAHQLSLINAEYNPDWLQRPTPVKTWQEAKDYCTWVGEIAGYPVNLPTEAQWEYAARNRGQKIYYATNDGQVRREASGRYVQGHWQDWLPEEWNYPKAGDSFNEVGTWPPNPLGIYDLSNNVVEWVNDWFSPDYYANSPELDPQGPATGTHRVQRGFQGERPLVTTRYIGEDEEKYYSMFGFRCGLQQDAPL